MLDKLVYIAPVDTLYNLPPEEHYYFNKEPRPINIISSFNGRSGDGVIASERRRFFLKAMAHTKFPVLNKFGNAGFIQLVKEFKNSKVLLNIHQTAHHHTLEEFRVGMYIHIV